MKRIICKNRYIVKSITNTNDLAKTYIFTYDNCVIMHKFALIKNIKIEHNLQASIESYALQEDAVDASALPSLEAFLDQGLM